MSLLQEKANQAAQLLHETNLDCWLTFARETELHPDPGIEQVVGAGVVRNSAFMFFKNGKRVAIVANFDTAVIRAKGVFQDVIGYDEDIRTSLVETFKRHDPQQIGLNYSLDDVTADGLTYGHWLLLQKLLKGTPYLDRLTSASPLLSRLRGRKSDSEVERIRKAIAVTEQIVEQLTSRIKVGMSERDLAQFVHVQFTENDVLPAWAAEGCPIVNSGPSSELGHTYPSDTISVQPGHLIHIDLGVKLNGYCSDLQRMWYVRLPGDRNVPADLQRVFNTVREAIEAGAAVLKPGVQGFEVDAAARKVVVDAGYPEFKHGLGHGLGRAVHDGGTMLGPRWACYGRNVESVVEAGNVFTLELGIPTRSGIIGLEEDVLVTADGCEFLSTKQLELMLI